MYALLNLINEEKEILQVDAFDKLGFGVRQAERAHRNLMSKYYYEVSFKKRNYRLIPVEETLGVCMKKTS